MDHSIHSGHRSNQQEISLLKVDTPSPITKPSPKVSRRPKDAANFSRLFEDKVKRLFIPYRQKLMELRQSAKLRMRGRPVKRGESYPTPKLALKVLNTNRISRHSRRIVKRKLWAKPGGNKSLWPEPGGNESLFKINVAHSAKKSTFRLGHTVPSNPLLDRSDDEAFSILTRLHFKNLLPVPNSYDNPIDLVSDDE